MVDEVRDETGEISPKLHPRVPGHRVVVVGGGFGGLQAVSSLRRSPVDVTLVDRRNFHLFQPLRVDQLLPADRENGCGAV